MKVTLPHWLAIVATGAGILLDGLSHLPALALYGTILTGLGDALIAGGLSHALVLPSITVPE